MCHGDAFHAASRATQPEKPNQIASTAERGDEFAVPNVILLDVRMPCGSAHAVKSPRSRPRTAPGQDRPARSA